MQTTLRFVCSAPCREPNQEQAMAIYHLSVKTISRSAGRSATAAAAYRAAARIEDELTGEVHDYRRKGGVISSTLLFPFGCAPMEREKLWNAAEVAEKRKNSTVAREFEIALPSELSEFDRSQLAIQFAKKIVNRHKCAADVSIHEPSKEGDEKNFHAHILLTTRRIGPDGLGEKTRELDERKSGEIVYWRETWANLANQALSSRGHSERIDHRSFEAQGITDRLPGVHLGPTATAIARKGKKSRIAEDLERRQAEKQAAERQARAAVLKFEAEIAALNIELREIELERKKPAVIAPDSVQQPPKSDFISRFTAGLLKTPTEQQPPAAPPATHPPEFHESPGLQETKAPPPAGHDPEPFSPTTSQDPPNDEDDDGFYMGMN